MAKIISYDKEAREKIVSGVKKLSDAVGCSLGPCGRNALLGKLYGAPQVVNDGVTIAKEIELDDEIEQNAVALVREASEKTNSAAGDGTTTATILGYAILKSGIDKLDSGVNAVALKKGISQAAEDVIKFIEEKSIEVTDERLKQVAEISAGNDTETGELISEAMRKVGDDGIVTVEEAKSFGTSIKNAEGLCVQKGYLSPYFVTDQERMECILENPFILAVNKKINLINEIVPTLNAVAQEQRPLLIVAEDVEGECLASLVVNTMRRVITACAIKAEGFGESRKANLEDLCALTGGTLWTEELGVKLETIDPKITPEFYGKASRVRVTNSDTTIVVSERSSKLDAHIASLKTQLEQAETDYDKEKLTERIAKLNGGVAVIQVGAATESELKERKLRIEDALNACEAAKSEGIVHGGGFTLLEAQKHFENSDRVSVSKDFNEGYDILIKALSYPTYLIAENAGKNGDEVVAKCKETGLGYNALTDTYENLLETGVIDPAKVTKTALRNAASVAGLILTTQVAIVPKKPDENTNQSFQPSGSPMVM